MKKIALIEDDTFIQDFVSVELAKAGYLMTTCGDGEKALEHIKTNQPDLVLLDLDLPNLSGNQILQALRQEPATKEIPIIIFSNNDSPEVKNSVLQAGATDFYLKATTDPTELETLIVKYL